MTYQDVEIAILVSPQFPAAMLRLADMLLPAHGLDLLRDTKEFLIAIRDGHGIEERAKLFTAPMAIAFLNLTMGTPLFLSDELYLRWLLSDGTVAECSRCGYRHPAPWPNCVVCGSPTGAGGVWARRRAAAAMNS